MANELPGLHGHTKVSAAEAREHEQAISAKRVTSIPSNQQKKFEYSGGQVVYAGTAARSLLTSQRGWLLKKFTYSSDGVTDIQVGYDSWDNRAGASYG